MLRYSQGDPLAVLLLALVLHPVILRIKEDVLTLKVNSWFLNDGLLAGKADEVTEAIRIIFEEGPRRGLHLSTEITVPGNSKSAVWSSQSADSGDPLGLGIKPILEPGFTHLGAPVGSVDFVVRFFKPRVPPLHL